MNAISRLVKAPVTGCEWLIFDRHKNLVERRMFKAVRDPLAGRMMQVEIADIMLGGIAIERKVRTFPMDSYTAVMTKILESQFQNSGVSITDTGGTGRTWNLTGGTWLSCNGLITDATLGIVVGTGTNAVAIGDTALQTKIAHGTGSGQLSYAAMQADGIVTAGDTTYFKVKRRFTNNTASTITVTEFGLYVKDGAPNKFCPIREIISPGHDIVAGGTTEFRFLIPVTLASDSFGGLFAKIMSVAAAIGLPSATITDTGGTSRSVGTPVGCTATSAAASTVNGVVVGTNNTAVTHGDTKLGTQIAHGTGSGQLQYQAVQFDPTVVGSTDAYFGIKRTFDNGSGADITIYEGALYAIAGSGSWEFCLGRIVFGSGLTIANGGSGQCKFLVGVEV